MPLLKTRFFLAAFLVIASLTGVIKYTEHSLKDTDSSASSSDQRGVPIAEKSSPAETPETAWPTFRGNVAQTGVSASGLPEKLKERWKFKTDDGVEGTPAIADGVVYIGSYDENLYAIDLKTGKQKWKYNAEKSNGFRAPPAVHDGRVYVGDVSGTFHCVDAAKGTKIWTFNSKGEISAGASFAGDNILFGSGDELLYCLSKEGKQVWTFRLPGGPVMASPAIVKDKTFLSGCDSTLHVIDINTGKETASLELGTQTGSTPALVGDSLYVGTMGTQFLAINWKKPEIRWTFEAEDDAAPFLSSAAVTDKLVVVGSQDNFVHALHRDTGKPAWSFKTNAKVDSSPVIAGSRVYVGSLDRNLYVLDLEKGTQLQKIQLDGKIAGSPAIADGCLVIGTDKCTIYCFDGGK
jgi:outer membrane protein assembly factor BamB